MGGGSPDRVKASECQRKGVEPAPVRCVGRDEQRTRGCIAPTQGTRLCRSCGGGGGRTGMRWGGWNERTNERANERLNRRRDEGRRRPTHTTATERTNERTNKRTCAVTLRRVKFGCCEVVRWWWGSVNAMLHTARGLRTAHTTHERTEYTAALDREYVMCECDNGTLSVAIGIGNRN